MTEERTAHDTTLELIEEDESVDEGEEEAFALAAAAVRDKELGAVITEPDVEPEAAEETDAVVDLREEPEAEPEVEVEVEEEPEPALAAVEAEERIHLTYQPALDGLRGLAVAGVLLFHAGFGWAKGGYLGVSTFFTLSGFLITSLLVTERERTGSISLPRFWSRRFRRLMPAALAALAFICLFGLVAGDDHQLANLRGDVLAALAYVANWRFIVQDQSYADLFTDPSPVQHFWSLAIEEQFYAFFPLLTAGVLALALRIKHPFFEGEAGARRLLFGVLGAMAVVSVWLMVTTFEPGHDTSLVYYGTHTRMAELLTGALLAVVLAGRGPLRGLARRIVAIAGLVGLVLTVIWWNTVAQTSSWLFSGGLALYAVVSAVVVAAAVAPGGAVRSLLSWEPLRRLGLISYGVYVYHWPVFLWLSPDRVDLPAWPLFMLRFGVTLGLSVVSYRLLEMPIRRRERVVGERKWLAAPAGAAAVALAVFVVTLGAPTRAELEADQVTAAAPLDPAEVLAQQVESDVDAGAVQPATPVVDTVLLVGDSVMGQGLEQFQARFEAEGIAVGYAGGPGTGPLFPQGDWIRQIDENVERLDPDVVIIEACCDYARAPQGDLYRLPDGTQVQPGSEEMYVAWEREIRAAIDHADDGGAEVFVVLAPPVQTNGFYGNLEEQVTRLNDMYRSLGVPLINWGSVLAPGGEYTPALPGPGGESQTVRLEDGVHNTPYGYELLADASVAPILALEDQPAF